MATYRLNDEVEKRLKAWADNKYRNDAGRIALERHSFSDLISDLLHEVGF